MPPSGSFEGYKVRFYQLEPEASKQHLQEVLSSLAGQVAAKGEAVMGAIMFTCGGRGRHFFQEDSKDAKSIVEASLSRLCHAV